MNRKRAWELKLEVLGEYRKKAYEFIRDYKIQYDGCSPVYAEIEEAIGAKSKSTVSSVLADLEQHGFIEVVHLPGRRQVLIKLVGGKYTVEA